MDDFIKLNINYQRPRGAKESFLPLPVGTRDADGKIHGLENLDEGIHRGAVNGNVVVCQECGLVLAEIVDEPPKNHRP